MLSCSVILGTKANCHGFELMLGIQENELQLGAFVATKINSMIISQAYQGQTVHSNNGNIS